VSKRLFDLVLVLAAAPVILALCAGVALVVWISLGRPILFKQARAGRFGERFTLLKFRTMRPQGGAADRERLGASGRWLRMTSLDELPQFWNVLRGEMSLVGPRPLLPEYVQRYSAFQARRLEVLPGITGWAQVRGRNGLGWSERFKLDVWYVEHAGMRLDAKILFMTVWAVLSRKGVVPPGGETMGEFNG